MHLRLITTLCLCSATIAVQVTNETTLDAKERARRLIPYMAVYLTTPVSPVAQGIAAQYRPQTKNSWPYPQSQSLQPQHYAVPVHLVHTAHIPSSYSDLPLTKSIAQNYLTIAKQIGSKPASGSPQPDSFTYINQDAPVKQYHQENYEPIVQFKPLHNRPLSPLLPSHYSRTPLRYQYTEQPKIKQHLTEITRPNSKPSYDPQIHDLATLNYEKNPRTQQILVLPSNKQYPQPTTEQTVTITQSQELPFNDNKYQNSYTGTPSDNPISYKEHREYFDDDISSSEESSEEDSNSREEGIDGNFNDILHGVSLTKTLPDKITPDNLDSSIKALSKLLRILQQANKLPHSAKQIVKTFPRPTHPGRHPLKLSKIPKKKPISSYDDDDGGTPGRAGIDYPNFDEIPPTKFNCAQQRYKGFFGDPDTGCQVWHYCDLNGGQASFLCPNGTIFSQAALTCDWWFNVKCSSTTQQYVLNERLYKFILPHKPSFPEDYAGPEVDHYLSLKFREIERNKTLSQDSSEESPSSSESSEETRPKLTDINRPYSLDDVESENRVRSIAV